MPWTLSAFADEAGPTITEQITALHRAGVKYIDPRMVNGHNISVLPLDEARHVRNQLDAAGIKVQMFGSPIGKISLGDDMNIDLQKLAHLGQLADILDCRAVRIFSYFNQDKLPHDQWRKIALDRLGQLKKLAGDLGLVLYHENERHIYGDFCADVLEIAQALRDGKTFKMIFDFANFLHNGEDAWTNWQQLRLLTDAIHLKDCTPAGHTPAGQGNGKVRETLRDLVAMGWSGPLTIEPHLKHSAAVLATGPSGEKNFTFEKLSEADVFHIAATAATQLIADVGVKL
jgi:sugar phosphate isomerase/epimerase